MPVLTQPFPVFTGWRPAMTCASQWVVSHYGSASCQGILGHVDRKRLGIKMETLWSVDDQWIYNLSHSQLWSGNCFILWESKCDVKNVLKISSKNYFFLLGRSLITIHIYFIDFGHWQKLEWCIYVSSLGRESNIHEISDKCSSQTSNRTYNFF